MSVIIWNGENVVPPDVSRALIVARNGCFQLKRIRLGSLPIIEAITHHGPGWDDESLQDFSGERLSLGFAEKIPQTILQQALAFFSAIYTRLSTEAIVLLFYAPSAPVNQRWLIMAPEQTVTGGTCKYEDPGPAPSGWFLAGTIHSHGNMGAFHSGTDDHDEDQRDGIHITVGRINSLVEFSVSVVIEGERFKLELSDIVQGVTPVDFDHTWLQRVRKYEPPTLIETNPLATFRATQQLVHPAPKKGGKNER